MVRLLSTDFDGTLVDSSCESHFQECPNSLSIELEHILSNGPLWLINSGRPLDHLLERLESFNTPAKPNYLITNERYLYEVEKNGNLKEFSEWNQQCDFLHRELFKICGDFFDNIRNLAEGYGKCITILENSEGYLESLLAAEEEIIDEIELLLHRDRLLPRSLSFQRSSTFLRFTHQFYNKGSALKELSYTLKLKPKNILAIGDHYNDVSMLNYEVAQMMACPFNAHDKIKKIVTSYNGYVAAASYGEGTAEAINFYRKL